MYTGAAEFVTAHKPRGDFNGGKARANECISCASGLADALNETAQAP
jgi:hypothetical protein